MRCRVPGDATKSERGAECNRTEMNAVFVSGRELMPGIIRR
jgi:hypothetical protein